jgi:hypothetical protein
MESIRIAKAENRYIRTTSCEGQTYEEYAIPLLDDRRREYFIPHRVDGNLQHHYYWYQGYMLGAVEYIDGRVTDVIVPDVDYKRNGKVLAIHVMDQERHQKKGFSYEELLQAHSIIESLNKIIRETGCPYVIEGPTRSWMDPADFVLVIDNNAAIGPKGKPTSDSQPQPPL